MSGAAECGSELLDEGAHELVFLVDVVGVELADSKRSELGMVDALLNAFQGFGQGESGVDGWEVSRREIDEVHDVDVDVDQDPVDSVFE